MHHTKIRFSVLFVFISFTVFLHTSRESGSAMSSTTYYVDCIAGNDSHGGTSPASAWKSLRKANGAHLVAGDSLLLKRGCTWTGPLIASWNGTDNQQILISAYGAGELPRIQNGPADLVDRYHNNVDITGSYQTIEYIEAAIVNPPVDPGCQNNPVGFYVGFNFRNPDNLPDGGSHNLLRYVKASGHTAGAHLNTNTHHNRIMKNTFTDNHVMHILTPISVDPFDDIGAWGILLRGNNQEVGYNHFSNNNAWCTYDTSPQGNAVELFEARNNVIHHNISINDRVFSELGGSPAVLSANNSYVYNLVFSSIHDSHFIVTRGAGSTFGPVYRTRLYHNTVYYTGPKSQGFICGGGCSDQILTAENNIVWAEEKAAFADAPFNEGHNIYWNSSGTPFVQFQGFTISPMSMIVNPQFVNPLQSNFRLKPSSPAIDAGMNFNWKKDLDCIPVPQGAGNDIGAYELPGESMSKTVPGMSSATTQRRLYLPLIKYDIWLAPCS